MPWSTKRTMNKGPSRHVLRLLILVLLAWILIYTLTSNHAQDVKTLRSLLRDEYQSKHSVPRRVVSSDDDDTLTGASDGTPNPHAGILLGGPQIGSAKIDLLTTAQDSKEHSKNTGPKDNAPIKPPPHGGASPPHNDDDNNHPAPSSFPPPSTSSSNDPPSPWLKTNYSIPLSLHNAPGLPNTSTARKVQHLLLTPSVATPSAAATGSGSGSYGSDSGPSLLILVMTRDAFSWGRHEGKLRRFEDFLAMVEGALLSSGAVGMGLEDVALGVLTSGEAEWRGYAEVLEGWSAGDGEGMGSMFGGVHLIRHPGYMGAGGEEANVEAAREERHRNELQHERRAEMAKLRNYLMQAVLGTVGRTAAEVLWLDADVFELSEGLVGDMRRGMAANGEVGVLTALCTINGGDYDLNAWRGRRSSPNEAQKTKLREPGGMGSWVASLEDPGHMGDLMGKDEEREEVQRVFRENIEKEMTRMAAEQDERERREIESQIAERYTAEEKRLEELERWVNSMAQDVRWQLTEDPGKPKEEAQAEKGPKLVKRESAFVPSEAEFEDGDEDDEKEEKADGDNESKGVKSETEKTYDPSPTKDTASSTSSPDDASSSEPKQNDHGDLPDFFRLDAVGATVLMMRADLVRQGLTFATSYLVGTDWEAEGWDAIESEGLCITARSLGSGCWGMKKGFSKHVTG